MAGTSSAAQNSWPAAAAASPPQSGIVGPMFMGQLPVDGLFPFPDQTPAERAAGDAVLARVANFLTDHVDADRIDADREIPSQVIAGLRQLGLFGIQIPVEFGGLGLSRLNYSRIVQLVASHCASTAMLLVAHQSVGLPLPLQLYGSAAQRADYLPRLAAGAISALALSEPAAGSDPSRMATLATPTADGTAWLINGEKLWVSNGPIAELLIVLARTNEPQAEPPEITAFIVEAHSPGFSVANRCAFMGLKGLQNGLLRFDNVRVPAENIIGDRGQGLSVGRCALNAGRLALSAHCSGVLKQVLALATAGAKERQRGAPIGEHEAVAAKLAGIAADLYAVDSLTRLTSALADRGTSDLWLETAMTKLYNSEALWRCVDAALQVSGGLGYETAASLAGRGELPIPMERLLRDARTTQVLEGTSEDMHLFIAGEILDQHRRMARGSDPAERVDYLGAAKAYAAWYAKLLLPNFRLDGQVQLPESLRQHLHELEQETRRLGRDLFHMIACHRQRLPQRQRVLARLVECGVELFAIGAVLSRAGSPSAPAESTALAELFCRQARRRVAALRRGLYRNDDAGDYRFARTLLDGRFAWLTENIVSSWRQEKPRG